MKEKKPKVLLTDGASKSTLTAARVLARRGIEVHVGADTRIAISMWSRFVTRRHLLPTPQKNPQAFSAALMELQEKWQYDVVIPISDYDIAALLQDPNPEISTRLNMALPSREAFETARDKSRMIKRALAVGVPCPETWFPDDEPIEAIRDRARYPLLIKPNHSDGARGITVVEHQEALCSTYHQVVDRWGPSHLQELIPAGGGQLKSDIVVGRQGEILALFVCKKIRFFPVTGGSSTLIVSQRHSQIEQDTIQLAQALNWYGFADFDFIVDPRDGIAKLMECNPRFPESLKVDVFAGADFPWLVYQLALTGAGEPIPGYVEGRYARFLVGDIMWFLKSKQRWKANPSFFRFFGKELTYYVEQFDDPGPTLCYIIDALRTILSPRQMAYRFDRGFQKNKDVGREMKG